MGVWSVWGRMRERCKSVNKCKWEANHSKWQPTTTHLIWWLAPAHLSFDRSHQILRKYCDNIAAAAIFAIFLLHKAPWSFFLIETLSIVTTSYENVLWSDALSMVGETVTVRRPMISKDPRRHPFLQLSKRFTTTVTQRRSQQQRFWNKGAEAGKISVWSFELHYSYTVRLVNMRVSWIMNMPTCDASVYTIFVPGSGPS